MVMLAFGSLLMSMLDYVSISGPILRLHAFPKPAFILTPGSTPVLFPAPKSLFEVLTRSSMTTIYVSDAWEPSSKLHVVHLSSEFLLADLPKRWLPIYASMWR